MFLPTPGKVIFFGGVPRVPRILTGRGVCYAPAGHNTLCTKYTWFAGARARTARRLDKYLHTYLHVIRSNGTAGGLLTGNPD